MRHPSINGLAKFFNRLHHGLPAKYVDAGSLVLKGRLLPNAQCVLYQRPRVRPAGHNRASVVREHCAARASRRTAPKLNERRVFVFVSVMHLGGHNRYRCLLLLRPGKARGRVIS